MNLTEQNLVRFVEFSLSFLTALLARGPTSLQDLQITSGEQMNDSLCLMVSLFMWDADIVLRKRRVQRGIPESHYYSIDKRRCCRFDTVNN